MLSDLPRPSDKIHRPWTDAGVIFYSLSQPSFGMSRNATPQTEKSLCGDICQKTAAKRRLEISGQCSPRTFGVESVRSVAEIIVLYSAAISQLVSRQVSPVAF